ncbi:hypothetical protein ES705_37396 [subsurface metagenome]
MRTESGTLYFAVEGKGEGGETRRVGRPEGASPPLASGPARRALCPRCRGHFVHYTDPDTGESFRVPLSCSRLDCPVCGDRKRRRMVAEIMAGKPERLLTLTLRTIRSHTPHQSARRIRGAWRRFIALVRKAFPDFRYWKAMEFTKAGTAHLHVACRGSYIPQRMLRAMWLKASGSYIVHVEAIRDARHGAVEVAKYVVKSAQRLGQMDPPIRLTSHSRDWMLGDWKKDEGEKRGLVFLFRECPPPSFGEDPWQRLNVTWADDPDHPGRQIARCHDPPDPEVVQDMLLLGARPSRQAAAYYLRVLAPSRARRPPAQQLADEIDFLADPTNPL